MLNYFPVKGGVSDHYSPKTIMSGQTLNYKQCSLPVGTYCQVHEEDGQRNSLMARTLGAISAGPSSNQQGGHLFISLNTGCVLSRRSWTVVPMPQSVIDKVHSMAADQPRLIMFLDKHGLKVGDQTEQDVINPLETLYKLPRVVRDIAQIPGVDAATGTAIDVPAVEDNTTVKDSNVNDNDGKMNDLINIPRDPPVVDKDHDATINPKEHDTTIDPNPQFAPDFDSSRSNKETTPRKPKLPAEMVEPEQSKRIRKGVERYVPSMKGKTYGYTAAQISSTKFEPQISEMVLTQLTLKAAMKL